MMHEQELSIKARQIEASGDWLLVHALRRGRQRFGGFLPDDRIIEAYRDGLDLSFQKGGWGDLVTAKEIITGDISHQQGFFDRFTIVPLSLNSELSQDLGENAEAIIQAQSDKYQKTLQQLRAIHNAGITEIGYHSYVKGALIAVRVWQKWTQKKIEYLLRMVESSAVPKDSKQEGIFNAIKEISAEQISIAEDYLRSTAQEEESLGNCLIYPNYPFSRKEMDNLKFLKWLRQQGKT